MKIFYQPVFVLVLSLLSIVSSQAVTISVNETLDDDPAVNNDKCSLREAIIAANSNTKVDSCAAGSGADTISLPAGTYILTRTGADEASFAGDLDIQDAVTINGAGSDTTIIDGGKIERVFDVRTGSSAVININGVTIQNGDSGGDDGGGIYNRSKLTLGDVVISVNISGGDGAGIYNYGSATLNIDSSAIMANTSAGNGGGIYNGGELSITQSAISGNTASAGGGGLFNQQGTVTITAAELAGNKAGSGGGLYDFNGTTTITASSISDNSTSLDGAGLFTNDGVVSVSDSQINTNHAGGNGGGLYGEGTFTLHNSSIAGNTALEGGGAFMNTGLLSADNVTINSNTANQSGGFYVGSANLILTNSTVQTNTATAGLAGGIFNNGIMTITGSAISGNHDSLGVGGIVQQGTAIFSNTTISGNAGIGIQNTFGSGVNSHFRNVTIASNGAVGYAHAQTATLAHTIIANNGAADCAIAFGHIVTDTGWNLDSDNTCTFVDPSDRPGVNPLLGPLQDNGGTSPTHALLAGSPAIDAGNPAGCLDHNGALLTVDQRGSIRPEDGDDDGTALCDIGAYEFALSPDIVVTDSLSPADDLIINFPDVEVGNTSSATVTLTNSGQLPLNVSNVVVGGTDATMFSIDFTAGATPCNGLLIVINAGQNCTLAVSFSPSVASTMNAVLEITSNDPDEGIVVVTMSGLGTAPAVTPPAIDTTASGDAGGGGGCTLYAGAPFDPLLPLMFLLGGLYCRRAYRRSRLTIT